MDSAKKPAIAALAPVAAGMVEARVAFNLATSAFKPNIAALLAVTVALLADCTLLKAAVAAPNLPCALARWL